MTPQQLFNEGMSKDTFLKFDRAGHDEPCIECEECLRNGASVKIYLGRLPWQTRCLKCKASFRAEQVHQYHTKILQLAETLPWRHFLRYDFTVVPKHRMCLMAEALPEASLKGTSGSGYQGGLQQPEYGHGDNMSHSEGLPDITETFISNCQRELSAIMFKLRRKGHSDRVLEDHISRVSRMKADADHLREELQTALSSLEDFIEHGALSEASDLAAVAEGKSRQKKRKAPQPSSAPSSFFLQRESAQQGIASDLEGLDLEALAEVQRLVQAKKAEQHI